MKTLEELKDRLIQFEILKIEHEIMDSIYRDMDELAYPICLSIKKEVLDHLLKSNYNISDCEDDEGIGRIVIKIK